MLQSTNDIWERRWTIGLFLALPLIILLVFSYYPALKLFQMSLTDWDGMKPAYNYVGLDNYKTILRENMAWKTLINNMAYVIISVIQTFLGLYFAILLDSNIRGKRFFRSFLFMPYILNGVAVAYMFSYMYNFEDGPVNILLRGIGLEEYAVRFLGNSWWANMSLAFMGLWQNTGLAMVIFLGALQSIPKDLYESASIDGANFLHKVRFITVPSMKLVVQINLFLSLNGALQAFFQPFIMTKGGPGDRTQTFASMAYYTAFNFHNFGLASALGVFLLAIVLVVLLIQNLVIRGGGEEG
ncbi:carbohydrate ABC transporter permease [Paenibacillus mucilaginosus]|uniref:Binding-protein-dependent transport systems inner membrane component n=3 Tax=Paenibacillus mucilaginosus TaxID=61624 RepID=H6NCF1_9BACL|nr:sugar ABC transporter permease [Paenibacillus mucilaginosus]AEI39889.1 binding-protein-dependent transport systems inner membrane component [Paenibacillus mucilaginosus KNP414]AFC28564.1 binding-protein-dependent transport systems inner membrane component [Paenibacillus mucilaginosus 3016]AFH60729.1 ABC transporter permease [Paenibacillus mucilaginosus K02]MCG7217210.1 sugar ABC transporter permease [Paenibacillus mucilaginosus]WDM29166.1 sugar ABC transporter permease [Paenibacillus mucila